MALDAGVVGRGAIEPYGIDDVRSRWALHVIAPGTVASLATDVPLGNGLGLKIQIGRMTAVAQGAGGAPGVLGRIILHPPVGVVGDSICPPNLMRDVPLGVQR